MGFGLAYFSNVLLMSQEVLMKVIAFSVFSALKRVRQNAILCYTE